MIRIPATFARFLSIPKIPTQTDRYLVRQARQGNAEAYGEWVHKYQSLVFNVCYRLMGEQREAEVMTQETFCSVANQSWSPPVNQGN